MPDRYVEWMARRIAERKFNPAQPRDPGGEGGGRWIKAGAAGGAIMDALKKLLGDGDTEAMQFGEDEDAAYIDWSVPMKGGGRQLEASDEDGNIAHIDLSRGDLSALVAGLTRSRIRPSQTDDPLLHLAFADADDAVSFEDDAYIDWSRKLDGGGRSIAIGDADGNEATFDLTAAQFDQWYAAMALALMNEQS